MAKQVTVQTTHGEEIDYTVIESLEDIGQVFCHGPEETLTSDFNAGRTIMVNRMGGYCFFSYKYHTIIS